MKFDWPRLAAKVFAVVTMGVGAGFLSAAIAFVEIGSRGSLYNSPFGHIADVIGWGAGCLTASLLTFAMLYHESAKKLYDQSAKNAIKPDVPSSRGLD